MVIPRLIGMVHLQPLPGAPGFGGSLDQVIDRAVADAVALAESGFGGLMMENFGDSPFFADNVPDITVSSMTAAAREVSNAVDIPVGVNVLRHDALGALAVAAAADASYIRVNILSGSMFTDQGLIQGRAAEVARKKQSWCPGVAILADVMVKHAAPPAKLTIESAAIDTVERGGADGIIVSGTATGAPVDINDLSAVRTVISDTPLLVGSGATRDNIHTLLSVADSAICGTATKVDGVTTNPVDRARAAALVAAAD